MKERKSSSSSTPIECKQFFCSLGNFFTRRIFSSLSRLKCPDKYNTNDSPWKQRKQINHSLKWRFNKNSSVISHTVEWISFRVWFFHLHSGWKSEKKRKKFFFGAEAETSLDRLHVCLTLRYDYKFVHFNSRGSQTIIRVASKEQEQTFMAWIDIRSRTHNTGKANICFTFFQFLRGLKKYFFFQYFVAQHPSLIIFISF